ncbi:uncharacterized protein LOC111700422 isoform X2 [Eurytemora carolleeae]|nr:uncharacterized protein LOC111700422 isoform X2 [Eurytemora carolleeae]|eukprot:XP_023327083.1 uncharacterized protein LOC111700422 isoform X2 [Eurytemora affinis]
MGEENHGKPFGFCGCFKARTGAIVTAVLSMLFSSVILLYCMMVGSGLPLASENLRSEISSLGFDLNNFEEEVQTKVYNYVLTGIVLSSLVYFISGALLYTGAKNAKTGWMVPWQILTIFGITFVCLKFYWKINSKVGLSSFDLFEFLAAVLVGGYLSIVVQSWRNQLMMGDDPDKQNVTSVDVDVHEAVAVTCICCNCFRTGRRRNRSVLDRFSFVLRTFWDFFGGVPVNSLHGKQAV